LYDEQQQMLDNVGKKLTQQYPGKISFTIESQQLEGVEVRVFTFENKT
jgi:hypothetical protein